MSDERPNYEGLFRDDGTPIDGERLEALALGGQIELFKEAFNGLSKERQQELLARLRRDDMRRLEQQ